MNLLQMNLEMIDQTIENLIPDEKNPRYKYFSPNLFWLETVNSLFSVLEQLKTNKEFKQQRTKEELLRINELQERLQNVYNSFWNV